jgi:hypothetical protein
MGWSSGADVFDSVVSSFIKSNISRKIKLEIIISLIEALEDKDWDCQLESKYITDSTVMAAFRKVHPDWFEED